MLLYFNMAVVLVKAQVLGSVPSIEATLSPVFQSPFLEPGSTWLLQYIAVWSFRLEQVAFGFQALLVDSTRGRNDPICLDPKNLQEALWGPRHGKRADQTLALF